MKNVGDILIRNGSLFVDLWNGFTKKDLLISRGIIIDIAEHIVNPPGNSMQEIDATNQYVLPGFIDIHCHLRDPGQTHKETVLTGTLSAAAGGFTTIVAMANTDPILDTTALWETTTQRFETESVVHTLQAGAITEGCLGKNLSEIFLSSTKKQEGSSPRPFIFSDDGIGLNNPLLFQEAASLAKKTGSLLLLHEEEPSLVKGGILHPSHAAKKLHLKEIPSSSESICIARDLILAHEVEYTPHFTHVSALQSMEVLYGLDQANYHFTADTTPHHLFFTDEDIDGSSTNFKVNPPLRSKKDQTALKEGIRQGIISCFATDHAPHTKEEKDRGFEKAPFGALSFETAFGALYTSLVASGWISFPQLIGMLSHRPASILKLNKPELQIGFPGDIVLVDLEQWKVTLPFVSKSSNSPFLEKTLQGRIRKTLLGGTVIYDR